MQTHIPAWAASCRLSSAPQLILLFSCQVTSDSFAWSVALQALLSMEFSRQEYWSGLPFPVGDLPNPGIKPTSLTSPALSGELFTTSTTWELPLFTMKLLKILPSVDLMGDIVILSNGLDLSEQEETAL